jgi:DNA-3-methyladenine glycosylase
MRRLPISFYRGDDVIDIAASLLGKVLVSNVDGVLTAGRITEAEAYRGVTDRACHAFGGRRTPRNEVMYADGGHAYVYICYGIHRLFNVITNRKDIPDAVLIRSVEPLLGLDHMLVRSGKEKPVPTLAAGPGNLTRALSINMSHNGLRLDGPDLYIADDGHIVKPDAIIATPRIGVESAGQDALLPYRFVIRGNKWVSGRKNM